MTSILPTVGIIRAQIKDGSVRRAFDRATNYDSKTPYELTEKEVNRLFDAASKDNPYVKGDSTTPRELRDLQMIRDHGSWMLKTEGARKAFDKQLGGIKEKAQIEWGDDDANLRSYQPAVNKIAIRGKASGFVYCPPGAVCAGAPSTVSMTIEGKQYRVHPKHGESSVSIVRRLENQLKADGFKTKRSNYKGASHLAVIGRTAPKPGSLNISSITTDPQIHVNVKPGTNEVRIGVGIGSGIDLAGGLFGIAIEGKKYAVETTDGQSASSAFKALEQQIEDAGYVVKVQYHHGIDTIESTWTISKPDTVSNFADRTYGELKGTVKVYGDGDVPPLGSQLKGSWLELDVPIEIDGNEVSQIYVGDRRLKDGETAKLNGRLELEESPMEIFPPMHYARMTGVTNTGAGEPKYDGKNFTDKKGNKLRQFSYYRPFIADAPATIFVADHTSKNMFVGSHGGFLPPEMNRFHGFRGSAKISQPTLTETQTVKWSLGSTAPTNADGEKLTKVGEEPGRGGMQEWFLDPKANTLYQFAPTIRRGPRRAILAQVARLGDVKAWPFS